MKTAVKITILVGTGIIFALLIWLGLQIRPRPFAAFPQQGSVPETISLPDGLPEPVERFYRQVYGQNLPAIKSAVISGRATMRVNGITFPGRFRFTHTAGLDYRHYIEATFFGLPLMKINEFYLDGNSRMELPFGITEGEPKVDQAANLALWGESITWLSTILLTDQRVHWEPVDRDTALLMVPFGEEEERFVVRFDPETGLPHFLEAMRYREPADETKILWLTEIVEWDTLNGNTLPTVVAITWFDEGTPWATFTVEEAEYNVDVQEYILAKGP